MPDTEVKKLLTLSLLGCKVKLLVYQLLYQLCGSSAVFVGKNGERFLVLLVYKDNINSLLPQKDDKNALKYQLKDDNSLLTVSLFLRETRKNK